MSSRILIPELYAVERRADFVQREVVPFKQEVERWFLEFRDQVFRYLRATGCEHAVAEEITQEAFLRLYRACQSGVQVKDVRGWVFRVARNLYIDNRRERQRFLLACQDEPALRDRAPSELGPDPERQIIQRERLKRIEREVLRLPELQRDCMHLRAQGLCYREIAQTLDITLSAAVEFVRSAVKKLGNIASE